jgi:hypothetical protein
MLHSDELRNVPYSIGNISAYIQDASHPWLMRQTRKRLGNLVVNIKVRLEEQGNTRLL